MASRRVGKPPDGASCSPYHPKFFCRPSNRRGGSVRLLPSFIFPLRGKGGASCSGASLGVWALRRKAREGSVVRLTRVATNGLVDDTGFDGEQVRDWSIRIEGLSIADNPSSFQLCQCNTVLIIADVWAMCNLIHSIWCGAAHFSYILICGSIRWLSIWMQHDADSLHNLR